MAIIEATQTRLVIQRKRKHSTLIFHTFWVALGIVVGIGFVLSLNAALPFPVLTAPILYWGFVLFIFLSIFALHSLSFPPPTIYTFDKVKNLLMIVSKSNFLIGSHHSKNYPLEEIFPPQWRTDSMYTGGFNIVYYPTLILPCRRTLDGKQFKIHIHSFGQSLEDDQATVSLINRFLNWY